MATRRTVRRSVGTKGRKLSIWLGGSQVTPAQVPSGTLVAVELVANASLTAVGFQGHIARTRGYIAGRPETAAQDPVISWGIGVFDVGLTVAANFPDPTLEPRDPYFAWGGLYCGAAVLFNIAGGNIQHVDSKGKRRYNDSDRIMLVMKERGSSHTALIDNDFDVLVIPDQGA